MRDGKRWFGQRSNRCSLRQAERSGRHLVEIRDAEEQFFPAPMVASRYNVSDMTLYRWLRDHRMQFPKPHYFGRYPLLEAERPRFVGAQARSSTPTL